MKRFFKNIGWFLIDPFKITRKEFARIDEIKKGLEDRNEVLQRLFEEGKKILNEKPIDWDKYTEIYNQILVAREEYENFANKYVRL